MQPWERELCPILTKVPESSKLVAVHGKLDEGAKFKATACQGPNCAWYLTHVLDGKVVGGGCSVKAIPAILSNIMIHLAEREATETKECNDCGNCEENE